MATKEQQIINARYINQRLTLDTFEENAVLEIQNFYTQARKGVLADINRAVARDYDISTQSRLFDLLDEIDSMIKGTQGALTDAVADAAGHAGAFTYKDTNQILSWDGRNKDFNYVALSAAQITSLVKNEPLAGKHLGEWLWSALDADNGALRADINAARVRGLGYDRILTSLGDRYDDLFDATRARRDLETVTKSYIQAANAKAHSDIYDKNRDVMGGVEWSAIMENGNKHTGRGTCPRCQALDGMKYKDEKEGPPMPLHARCRCMYLPLTLTWKELFGDDFDVEEMAEVERKWYERDEKTRKILDTGRTNQTYGEWWKTKPEGWQNNAIGPYRAGLVRDNAMAFTDIVDAKTGRLIPLNELVSKGIITKDELDLVRGGKKGGGGGGAAPAAKPKPAPKPKKLPAGPLGDFNPYDIKPYDMKGYRVATDLKDAEKVAADMGLVASYRGYDLEMAEGVNQSWARMNQAFTNLQGQEMFIGTKDFVVKNFGKAAVADKVAAAKVDDLVQLIEVDANEWLKAAGAYTDSYYGKKYFKKWEKRNPGAAAARKLLDKTPTPADIPEKTLRAWYSDKLVGRIGSFRGSTKAWGYTYDMADSRHLNGNGGMMVLNKVAKQSSFENDYRFSGKVKWHPPKTVEQWRTACVTHELGHNVDFRLTASPQGTEWQKWLTDEIYRSHKFNIKEDISEYALKNRSELVAEAIADVMDDEGGSPLSQLIVGKILELIAKGKT